MPASSKILIATGGTGGHVYPAIALAQQLIEELPTSEILFVGGGLSTNKYFDKQSFDHFSVACGALSSFSPRIFTSLFNIGKGIWQSSRIICDFQPQVAVGFGSFYAFPPLMAAKLMSVPLILHEANSIPGKVNRLLSRWAQVTGVHFPQTIGLLHGHAVEVGMPLRQGFRAQQDAKNAACEFFGLPADKTTLLVFGGSQGAKAINQMAVEALIGLQPLRPFQVLHFTGDANASPSFQKQYDEAGMVAVVKPYEVRMDLAWQAADLVVCRAGAGAIAEQLEFEVPGILIPYPKAADNHQEHNADFVVGIGGAVKLVEKDLSPDQLALSLKGLLQHGDTTLATMRQAISNYKKKSRTKDLCSLVKHCLQEC